MIVDSNQISLFAQSRNFEVKPIETRKLKAFLDPVQKTLLEYQQFKRNNKIKAQTKQKKHSKSFDKRSFETKQMAKLSQSVDYKSKGNQSAVSFPTAAGENTVTKKGTLYEGSSTSVYKVVIAGHFNVYALKISKVNPNKCTQEAYFLKQLRHPNIIELKHYYVVYDQSHTPNLHEIFPLMSCNLKQFITQFTKHSATNLNLNQEIGTKIKQNPSVLKFNLLQRKKAPQILFKLIIYQVTRAIAYLHSKHVTHRDLNPRNVLLDLETLVAQVCDFNSAKVLSDQQNTNYIGERHYRAPELLLGSKYYGPGVDLWSLGCLAAECFLGQPLFSGSNTVETMADIIKLLGTPKAEDIRNLRSPITDLKMPDIPKYPMERRFRDISCEHFVDFLEKVLVYDPSKRTPAFQLLLHPFFAEIKQPNIKINSKSLPNIFNFTKDELQHPDYSINYSKLIPEWYVEKQKRFEYMRTSMEDAKLILDK